MWPWISLEILPLYYTTITIPQTLKRGPKTVFLPFASKYRVISLIQGGSKIFGPWTAKWGTISIILLVLSIDDPVSCKYFWPPLTLLSDMTTSGVNSQKGVKMIHVHILAPYSGIFTYSTYNIHFSFNLKIGFSW